MHVKHPSYNNLKAVSHCFSWSATLTQQEGNLKAQNKK